MQTEKTTSTSTQKDTYLYDVQFWREKWANVVGKLRTDISVKRQMEAANKHYSTADGMMELHSVMRGKAGVEKTRRAVETAVKIVKLQNKKENAS